jgi:hypothetical protein
MNKRTWLSLPIIIVMLLTLWKSAAFATDGATCPAGDFSLFNTNKVGCTFCAVNNPGTCAVNCLGSPACFCPEDGRAACCAATPCCDPCPESTSLECTLNSCGCDPPDCCFTKCPAAPAPAPALGAPNSTLFGVVAAALAIAGVLLIRRRHRLQRQ